MIKFELPFPDKDLSPNARKHWRIVWKKSTKVRFDACTITKAAGWEPEPEKTINVQLVFYPVKNSRFDLDNLLARSKSLLDGIADGLGVNDRFFKPSVLLLPKDGRARVEVTAWQD